MPKRLINGWFKGLGSGFEESGWFIGTFVPIVLVTLLFVLLFGSVVWVRGCVKEAAKPKVCTDYSYKMGIVSDREARCDRWSNMKMQIEERWLKSDVVHCKCTPASYPAGATK